MPEGPLARSSATRRRTVVTGLAVAFVTLACGGLLGAAALAPAPAVVLPLEELRRDLRRLPETEHPLDG